MHLQVSLLNQEVIIEKIQSAVETKLRDSNEGRTFQEQVCSLDHCSADSDTSQEFKHDICSSRISQL